MDLGGAALATHGGHTEAKLLLGCMRVEFKTDRLNEQSRTALQRIGAMEEGAAVTTPDFVHLSRYGRDGSAGRVVRRDSAGSP